MLSKADRNNKNIYFNMYLVFIKKTNLFKNFFMFVN